MPRIALTKLARADIVEILIYLRARSRQGARRVHLAINVAFEFLADNPGAGTEHPDFGPGIRSYPVRRYRDYLVFYLALKDGIQVLRVLHGSKDLPLYFR